MLEEGGEGIWKRLHVAHLFIYRLPLSLSPALPRPAPSSNSPESALQASHTLRELNALPPALPVVWSGPLNAQSHSCKCRNLLARSEGVREEQLVQIPRLYVCGA
jgi:hypothetical protein